ncbi:MAG: DNA polymerase IV [Endomicrobiales bacterium]|nr:DNA polymerase IV [Endomicrobiales bacterium]
MERTIFLIDMNSFFASIEQAANPALRGKPVVVCGDGRTIVTTASYEARAFGIKTGMTPYEAKRLCPGVINVRGDMHKYVGTSMRIHEILLEFSELTEPFSIDECFVDVTHLVKNGEAPKDIALRVKQRIKEDLNLLCSIGIGPNRTVAKLASKMRKPDGLVEIRKEDIPVIYSKLSVEDLQGIGIGKKISQKLKELGIKTAAEMGRAKEEFLMFHFGILGWHLKRVGLGVDSSRVKSYWDEDPVKSVGHSHTLPKDTRDLQVVNSYLLMLAEKTGWRLRKAGKMGRTVHFYVRFGDFTSWGKQRTLASDIKTGRDIYKAAREIFKEALPLKKPVRLIGVSISGLSRDTGQRVFLEEMERDEKLLDVVDEINRKYGSSTLKPSSVLIAENFGIEERCGLIGRYHFRPKR